MPQLTEPQKRKMLAAAEIVDKGDMAVLEKLLEFMDFLDENESKFTQLRADFEMLITTHKENKDAEMSSKMSEIDDKIEEFKENVSNFLENNKKDDLRPILTDINRLKASLTTLIGEISKVRDEIPEMPPQTDLTDIFNRLVDIENKIPKIPDEITGEKIVDKINELPIDDNEHKIDIEHIKEWEELEKRLLALESRPVGRSGGTSAMGVAQAFKYIAHTEQPVGDIDGVNTTYTVKNNIWWIAGFTINGEQIAELPNFTFINHTITFAVALPAAFSGKDFEVKYIGT